MNQTINIYALYDPRNPDEVRYIGQTKFSLKIRLRRHITRSKKKDIRSARWINKLKISGAAPSIRIIEIASIENYKEREKFWIKHYRKLGNRLTNVTDGGEGTLGWVPSKETREKIRNKNKGWTPTEEQREKMSLAQKARIWTEEQRKQYSIRGRAYRPTKATKKKISASHLGKVFSEAHKKNISLSKMGSVISKEQREKHSIKMMGHSVSKETRKKMSHSLLGNKRALGHKHTEKTKQNMSRAQQGHPVSEKTRKKLRAAALRQHALKNKGVV